MTGVQTCALPIYLDLTDVQTEELSALCQTLSRAVLLAHCRLLEDAFFAMQNTHAVKRLVAEMTLVRMCDPKLDTSPEGMLSRIARLEDAIATGNVQPSAPAAPKKTQTEAPATEPVAKASAPAATPAAPAKSPSSQAPAMVKTTGGRTLTRVRGFMNCVERIRRENSMLASFTMDARVFIDEKGDVICKLQNDFSKMLLEEPQNRELFARALSAEIGKPIDATRMIVEVPDAATDNKDTVLDDLIGAAEQ